MIFPSIWYFVDVARVVTGGSFDERMGIEFGARRNRSDPTKKRRQYLLFHDPRKRIRRRRNTHTRNAQRTLNMHDVSRFCLIRCDVTKGWLVECGWRLERDFEAQTGTSSVSSRAWNRTLSSRTSWQCNVYNCVLEWLISWTNWLISIACFHRSDFTTVIDRNRDPKSDEVFTAKFNRGLALEAKAKHYLNKPEYKKIDELWDDAKKDLQWVLDHTDSKSHSRRHDISSQAKLRIGKSMHTFIPNSPQKLCSRLLCHFSWPTSKRPKNSHHQTKLSNQNLNRHTLPSLYFDVKFLPYTEFRER